MLAVWPSVVGSEGDHKMNVEITLTPMRLDTRLTLEKQGDTLIINGEGFDLSDIPDGAVLPRHAVICDWLASGIERTGDTVYLTLILPHGPNAPIETLYPQGITIALDGPITLPAHSIEEAVA